MRKYIGILLTMALVLGMLPLMVAAETTNPLWDVEKGKWYYKAAHEAFARGIIEGKKEFGVQKFAPDDHVSQNQALIIVLRYLGLEDNVKNMSALDVENRLSQIGVKISEVPEWSRAYVAYAIGLGYVKNKHDALDRDATRLWLAQLLVRVVEKEAQALSTEMMKATNFADDRDIPSNQKGYVNTIVSLGLMEGESKNGIRYFNPEGVTSRAVMATLLSRLDKHRTVPSNYSKEVVIKELTETGIEFQNEDGSFETIPMNNPIVFKVIAPNRSEKVQLREINKYDNARLVIRNNEIVFVDLDGTKGELKENLLFGKLDKVVEEDRIVLIKDHDDKLLTLRYVGTLIVKDADNKASNVSALQKGQDVRVTLELNSDTFIKEIMIQSKNDAQVDTSDGIVGIFFKLIPEDNYLMIELTDGSLDTYTYNSDTILSNQSVRLPDLSQLKQGDRIRLTVKGTLIEKIEVLAPGKENQTVKATFLGVEQEYVSYRVDNEPKYTKLSAKVTIVIKGLTSPKLTDLKRGDQVTLSFVDGEITRIEVGTRSTVTLKGTYIGSDAEFIYYKDTSGNITSKKIMNPLAVEIDGLESTMDDLPMNQPIIMTIDEEQVVKVVLDNERVGKIKKVDLTSQLIVVTLSNNTEQTYKFVNHAELDLYGVNYRNGDLSELQVGYEVRLYLAEDGKIRKLVQIYKDQFLITSVVPEINYILAEKNKVQNDFYYTDKTKLFIKGIESTSWISIYGKTATLTFLGNELDRVEVK